MAFFISPSLFAKVPTIFFIIQGDAKYSYVATESGRQVVKERLQYEILEEIQAHVRSNNHLNALIFFDSPDGAPSLEIYREGKLISNETLPEDFTDPQVLTSVFEKGYDHFPNSPYLLFHWGYTLPIYPQPEFDLSHPDHVFSIAVLREALYRAGAYLETRKLEAIILSTCFNSSLEVLYALNSFTKQIIATEIYLYHRGFSVVNLESSSEGFYTHILENLKNSIPIGPASGKPVLDYSVTWLKTDHFWDFHDRLERVFYDLIDILNNRDHYDRVKEAFRSAMLKNSRGRPYLDGLFDLKVFVDEFQGILSTEDLDTLNNLFATVVHRHEGITGSKTRGLNFTVPIHDYPELLSLNEEMKRSYLRGIYIGDFLKVIEQRFFEIFGVTLTNPFPVRYQLLAAYFPEGHIPAPVIQKFHDAEKSPETIITEVEFEGVGELSGQGNFIGRLGTHRLELKNGLTLHLVSSSLNLDRYLLQDGLQQYRLRGILNLSKRAWSRSYDVVLNVQNLTILPSSSR